MKLPRRAVYKCCVGGMVMVAAVVTLGGSQETSTKPKRTALRRNHLPNQIHRRRDQTTSESYNWSGYAVTGANGSVSEVNSSWIVPSVAGTCSSTPEGYAAFWTGIDGWTSSTVEQIGTDSDCVNLTGTKTATPTYYAWFEFYPQDAYLIGNYTSSGECESDCVFPGDKISAEVKFTGSSTKGFRHRGSPTFSVTITDETRGWSFTTSSSVPGAEESSAEWIAETPFGCDTSSGFCQFADFGRVDYGDYFTGVASTSYATVSGTTAPIGSFGNRVQKAVMVNYPSGSTTMAEPSVLESDGSSFSDSWFNAGP